MQRLLPKSAAILALILAVPVLCLAWTADLRPASREFDHQPAVGDSSRGHERAPIHNGPASAVNIPAHAQKAAVAPKRLYPPNVARDPRDSQTAEKGLASLLSFLLPTKEDLEKCFKGDDEGFRDRGRSNSGPFRKTGWK
jgi:hypothetical protein